MTRTCCYGCYEHSALSSIMNLLHRWKTVEIMILDLHKAFKDTIFQSRLVWLGQAAVKRRQCHLQKVVMSRRGRIISEHVLGMVMKTLFWEREDIIWTSGNHSVGKMHWLWNNVLNCEVVSHLWILKVTWVKVCNVRESCIGCETAGMVKMYIGIYICWDNSGKLSWITYPLSFDRGCFTDIFNESIFPL